MSIGKALLAASLLLFLGGNAAYAQTDAQVNAGAEVNVPGVRAGASASTTIRFQERKEEVQEKMAEIRVNLMERQDARAGASTTVSLKAAYENALERMREARASFAARAELARKRMAEGSERGVKLQAEAKARVEGLLTSIMRRFESALAHLENVSGRLEAKIGELEQEGGDFDGSAKLLAEADAKLVLAKEDVAEAKALVSAELGSTTTRETVRAHIETAKESIKEAREAYMDVVQSIRAEVKAEAEAEAS